MKGIACARKKRGRGGESPVRLQAVRVRWNMHTPIYQRATIIPNSQYACEQMRTRSTAPNSGCSSLATDIPLLRDMALTKWPGSTSLHRPDRAGETNFRGLLGREGADRRTRE